MAENLDDFGLAVVAAESKNDLYNSVNGGRDDSLTERTVADVIAGDHRLKGFSSAAGLPQVMPDTLTRLVKNGVVKETDKFNEQTQNRILNSLLDQRGRKDYLEGNITKDQFQNNLAKEWAGIPVATKQVKEVGGKTITINPGESYYKDIGGNKATISLQDFNNIAFKNNPQQEPQRNVIPSGFSRDTFNYAEYAKQALGDNREEYNDAQKDYIYKNAVESAYKELKTGLKLGEDEALKKIGEMFVDGYETLGKHRPKEEAEQRKALTLEGFNSWVKPFVENNKEFKDYSIKQLAPMYLDGINAKNGYTLLKDKSYSKVVKKNLSKRISDKYGDDTASSLFVDESAKKINDTATRKLEESDSFWSRKMLKSAAVSSVEQLKQMIPSYTYNKETAYSSELADSMQALDKIDPNKEIDLEDIGKFTIGSNKHDTTTDKLVSLVAKIRKSKDPIKSYFISDNSYTVLAHGEIRDKYNKATPEERKAYIDELKKESTLLFNKSGLNKSIASDEITTSERRIAEYDDPNFSEGQKIVRDVIANAPQAVAQVGAIAVGSRLGMATATGLGVSGALGAQSGITSKTQALREGATEEEADKIGILSGISETGTEFFGGKLLEPLLKAGGNTLKDTIKSILGEGITEGVNAPLQEYIKSDAGLSKILNNDKLTSGEKATEMLKLAGHSAAVGSLSSAAISTPIALSQKLDEVNARKGFTVEEIKNTYKGSDKAKAGFNFLSPYILRMEKTYGTREYLGMESANEYADTLRSIVGNKKFEEISGKINSLDDIDAFEYALTEELKKTKGIKFHEAKQRWIITDINDKKQKLAQSLLNIIKVKKPESGTQTEDANTQTEGAKTSEDKPSQKKTTEEQVIPKELPSPKREKVNTKTKNEIIDANKDRHEYTYDVVEADSIDATVEQASNQFRNRNREQLVKQVDDIANNTDYELIGSGYNTFDMGAPVYTKDGVLVAGNGRALGIKKAYDIENNTYRDSVIEDADSIGLGDKAKSLKKPVLVRRLVNDVDVEKIASLSNKSNSASMSNLEKAPDDLNYIDIESLFNDGEFEITPRAFDNFPGNDKNSLVNNGKVESDGYLRISNALFSKAYGDTNILSDLIEKQNSNSSINVLNAMRVASPKLALLEHNIENNGTQSNLSLINDITKAYESYKNWKSKTGKNKQSLDEFIANSDMLNPLTEEQQLILRKINDGARNPKALSDFLNGYADKVNSLPANNTADMFGGNNLSVMDVINMAEPSQKVLLTGKDGLVNIDDLAVISDTKPKKNKKGGYEFSINGNKYTLFKGKNGKYTLNKKTKEGTTRVVADEKVVSVDVPVSTAKKLEKHNKKKDDEGLLDLSVRYAVNVDEHINNANVDTEQESGIGKRNDYYQTNTDNLNIDDNAVSNDTTSVNYDADIDIPEFKFEAVVFDSKYQSDVSDMDIIDQVDSDSPNSKIKSTKKDLEPYIQALPEKIRDRIILLDAPDNYLAKKSMRGAFAPNFSNNEPAILINLYNSNMETVLQTLGHEVNHFSFDAWNDVVSIVAEPIAVDSGRFKFKGKQYHAMQILYNEAWDMLKSKIITEVPRYYFDSNKIDVSNPTLQQKQLLLDEYFARYNTSILALRSYKAMENFFEADTAKKLIKLSENARKRVIFDFRSRVDEEHKDNAESFAEKIMEIQREVSRDKLVSIEFSDDGNSVRLTPTPFGAIRETFEIDGLEPKMIRYNRLQGNLPPVLRKMHYAVHGTLPQMNPLGDTIPHLIASAGQSTSKSLIALLRKPKIVSLKVRWHLSKVGIDVDNIKEDTYTEAFLNAGLTKKGQLKTAKEADEYIHQMNSLSEKYYIEMIQEIRRSKGILIQKAEKGRVSMDALNLMLREVNQFEESLKEEWSHRQYRTYTPEGVAEVRKMIKILDSSDALAKHRDAVKEAKAELEALSNKEELSSKEYRRKTKLERTVNLENRIKKIESYVKLKDVPYSHLGYDLMETLDIVQYTDQLSKEYSTKKKETLRSLGFDFKLSENAQYFMETLSPSSHFKKFELVEDARRMSGDEVANEIEGFISKYEEASTIFEKKKRGEVTKREIITMLESIVSEQKGDRANKLQIVSEVRHRKIDEDTQAGRDYIDFLEEIKNPLEVSMMNLQGRARIKNIIKFHNNLFTAIIDNGGGHVRSSIDTSSNTRAQITIDQKGSILSFLQPIPAIRELLNKEINIQDQSNRTIVEQGVAQLKKFQTVYNAPTAEINYIGNVSTVLRNGKLTRLKNVVDSIRATKHYIKGDYLFDDKKIDYREQLVNELYEGGLLSTGAFQEIINMTENSIVDDVIDLVFNAVNADPSMVAIGKEYLDIAAKVAEGFYVGGDALPKIISYFTNRPLAIARYRAEYKQDADESIEAYNDRVRTAAIAEAQRLTRAETVDYSSVGLIPRQALNSRGIRVTFADYAMFPLTQINIELSQITELNRALKELKKYKNDNSQEANEYKSQLRSVIGHRIVGNALVLTGSIHSGFGLGSPIVLIYLGIKLASMSPEEIEEEKNKPMKDRTNFVSYDEFKAAAMLLHLESQNGYVYTPLASRDGWRLNSINIKNTVADYTWMPIIKPGMSTTDVATSILSNIVQKQPQDSLAIKLLSSVAGIIHGNQTGYFGQALSRSESIDEIMAIVPQLRDIKGVMENKEGGSSKLTDVEKRLKIEQMVYKYIGQRRKSYDLRKITAGMAYDFKTRTDKKQSPEYRIMMGKAEENRELSIDDFANQVNAVKKLNEKYYKEALLKISLLKRLGMNQKEIAHYMRGTTSKVKRTRISYKDKESAIQLLLKGDPKENPYDKFMINAIKRKISAYKSESPEEGILSEKLMKNRQHNYENLLSAFIR